MGGYSEEELLNLLKNPKKRPARIPYWTSEVYGAGEGLREYGYYPEWFPLYVFTDHGVLRDSLVCQVELEHDAEAMFYHSIEGVKEFKTLSKIPCYCYYSPLVFYRKNHKIEQDKDAKGTLACPAHGIDGMTLDLDKYMQQLKDLPEEFQPVGISLHRDDIESGVYKKFLNAGFEVYTAGDPFDKDYAKRFYGNLKKFKYTTSNVPGSFLFYAVEMGIPFFIYGDEICVKNYTRENNETFEEYDPMSAPQSKKTCELFRGIRTEINKDQKEYVEKMLGIRDCISRRKMAQILYLSYLKRGNIIRDLNRYFRYKIKGK